jgi:KTSC domain-containing protein
MRRTAVTSESLASVGYDSTRQLLEIEFASGEIYRYYQVPVNVHRELMAADSHGRYFIANIRPRYGFVRIGSRRCPRKPAVARRQPRHRSEQSG